ncbi:major facilitator superfamily domain-containing protein [Aspergillus nidulans var. acristatus]
MSTANPSTDMTPLSATRPYTSFTPRGRMLIVIIAGFATITSPLTATGQLRVSPQAINMTLTIYIVFQAISPAIFGPLSDAVGRRPIFLLTLAIYALANLGMALNKHNYGLLLLLRALQSLGASAAFAISYGIVADVCVSSERGKTMAWVSMALNLGTCLGPIIGGLVAYLSGNIEWIFWALFIVGLLLFFIVGMFLPETARNLVGNGSDQTERTLWQQCWWCYIKNVRLLNRKENEQDHQEYEAAARAEHGTLNRLITRISAPFSIRMFAAPLRIIFFPDTFWCLWINESFYTVDYILAATVPNIFTDIYQFNMLLTGLAYLPRGIGIIVSSYCNGKIMDHNYKVTARKHDQLINHVFANYKKHFLILLVLQFIQGFWGTCFYTIYNTLLIDVFPENPSTAAASASITRCALAAIGVTILQPVLDAAGLGWYFTALGLFTAVCGVVAVCCVYEHISCYTDVNTVIDMVLAIGRNF